MFTTGTLKNCIGEFVYVDYNDNFNNSNDKSAPVI